MAKVLVVEDSPKMIELLKAFLSSRGMVCDCVETAERGLEMVRASAYDIALIDINLPSSDGVIFLEQVKREDPKIIPIILTGEERLMRVLESLQYGAFDYICKSRLNEDLQKSLDRALVHIQRWDEIVAMSKKNQMASPEG